MLSMVGCGIRERPPISLLPSIGVKGEEVHPLGVDFADYPDVSKEIDSLKTEDYAIKKGDSLWKISRDRKTSISILRQLNGIDGEYEEESSKSTHPSIESRRDATAETTAQLSNSKRKKFLTDSQDKFVKVRDIARFELAYYYLHEFKYQEAIYACYILQQKYPNSLYLKKIIAKSLYGYTKFKNEIKTPPK